MIRETRMAPEMSITLCTRYSHASVNFWGDRHAIATRQITAVGGSSRARILKCIIYEPLSHRARYIHDHAIVLFDIILEQINFLGGVDLPFENCLHMTGLDKRLSNTAENVLGIRLIGEFRRLQTCPKLSYQAALVLQDAFITSTVRYILWVIFQFCNCNYYRVGQTIFR